MYRFSEVSEHSAGNIQSEVINSFLLYDDLSDFMMKGV